MGILRQSLLVLLGAVAVSSAACTNSTAPKDGPIDALPRPLSGAETKLVAAGNTFSFALFKRISAATPDSNLFVSPLSASMALGMTLNGAAGSTYDSMRVALQVEGVSQDEINAGYKELLSLLRGLDPATTLEVANSIWYRQEFPFEQSFFTAAKSWFDAEVRGLDFDDVPSSLAAINGWVDQRTNGKIPRIVEDITRDDVMFLINAIYFNGNWERKFDRADTRAAPFHALDGTSAQVPLMYQKSKIRYAWTPQYQAVDLAYGNSAFTMTVLLPHAGSSVNELAASLTPAAWTELVGRLASQEVELYLPKFKLSWERLLNDDLTAMGMGIAFREREADFTRMSSLGRALFITYVKQKAYVDVHEEGTEAAAVTVVAIGITSGPPTVRVDRPFIFAIRERFSGTILFMGKVVKLPAA
ncbi:MAG: serpin family protein [Gemmatimonadaceae bacterium]|nr:serpin family protein [Gemmatimonadaceae bacterium]